MTTEYSIQKMVSDGTLSTIVLGIQYLQRNDIYMRIAGEETPQVGAPSGYTWSFIDNTTLKILPVVPNGVEVVVYRRTDVDAMYNIYSQNAQFDEATIDENNQQLLYIAQEYLEQGIPGAGVDTLEFVRDDGTYTYYRIKRTDGSYSDEFAVPSAGSATKILAREALRRSYAEAVYNLVDGSFESGGVLTSATDVLLQESTGIAYSWSGTIPGGGYIVASGTSPTDPNWVNRSTASLRADLASASGSTLVNEARVLAQYAYSGATARTQRDVNRDYLHAEGFGVVANGTTDCTAAMVAAISSALANGKTLKLPQGVIMVNADALVIGDGSSTQPATKQALFLEGSGFAPYTRGGTVIKARTSGNALLTINGLIEGLDITNLQFDCAGIVNEGIVSTAVVGFNWDGFGVYDWKDNGLNFKNRALPSGGVTWSRANTFRRFFITSSYNRDYSSGIKLSGTVDPTSPPGPHDMHNSIFELGTIQMTKRPTTNACQGLYLGFTDSNQFREVDVIMTGTGYGYSATFTDENNVGQPYPQNNLFVGCSLGGDAPRVIGTPGKNYFHHYAMKDGESLPSNTTYLLGMTDEGKFFGPHGFDVINTMLKLKGATTNERALVFETPDGTTAAKIIHNSILGMEVYVWNGSGYVLASRYHPDGSIYMNFPAIGFKKIEYGAADSGGAGFRALRIAN